MPGPDSDAAQADLPLPTVGATAQGKPLAPQAPYRGRRIGNVDYNAPDAGPVEHQTVGGRVMRRDPQRAANEATRLREQEQQEALDRQRTQGGGSDMSETARSGLVERMRTGFQNNPAVRNSYGVAQGIAQARAALRQDSGLGDLDVIYSVVKVLDPNSVVREGEIALTKQANSLPGKFRLAVDNWNKGRLLTPEMRLQLEDVLNSKETQFTDTVKPVQREFGERLRRLGLQSDSAYVAPDVFEGVRRSPRRPLNQIIPP
mgnify:FL=1